RTPSSSCSASRLETQPHVQQRSLIAPRTHRRSVDRLCGEAVLAASSRRRIAILSAVTGAATKLNGPRTNLRCQRLERLSQSRITAQVKSGIQCRFAEGPCSKDSLRQRVDVLRPCH